mgnify:CR=1 FL=1
MTIIYKYSFFPFVLLLTTRLLISSCQIHRVHAQKSLKDCSTEYHGCNGDKDRLEVCRFDGERYKTACIKHRSALRRRQIMMWDEGDYCGPCTRRKPFETSNELKEAVTVYLSPNRTEQQRDELAGLYGWPMNNWNVHLVNDL